MRAKHELPPKVKELLKKKYAEESGPNCWNATLIFHGAIDIPCFVEEGMAEWLRESTRPLAPNEKSEWGDIYVYTHMPVIEMLDMHLEHTCVYLSRGRFWNKAGYHNSAPWEITNKARIDADYAGKHIIVERRRPIHVKPFNGPKYKTASRFGPGEEIE